MANCATRMGRKRLVHDCVYSYCVYLLNIMYTLLIKEMVLAVLTVEMVHIQFKKVLQENSF